MLVYEGSDDVTVNYSKDDNFCCMLEKHDRSNKITNNCNYDADISNCSTDINLSSSMQEDEHSRQGYLNNNHDHDHDIGIENDETNMDHCLYDDLATSSAVVCGSKKSKSVTKTNKKVRQVSPPQSKRMFLETPHNRSISPHSMDSWICYSNSSDEFSQDCILSKSIKRAEALHVGEDTEDVDVYDKINFVTNLNNKYQERQEATSSGKGVIKKSKMNLFDQEEASKSNITFRFPEKLAPEPASDEKDDGIGDEEDEVGEEEEDDDLEEIEEDEQLSSLSSNIDTIIVSENGTAKYFKSSSSNDNDLPNKKNRLSLNPTSSGTTTVTSTVTSATKSMATNKSEVVNKNEGNSLPVDIRIIDFAHTTFALKNGGVLDSSTSNSANSSSSNSVSTGKIHYGPDNGFLTGVLSLKRILNEIVSEYYQENVSK